jgi:hypothetical protein
MKKAMRLTLAIILCSSFQVNNSFAVENCTINNQRGKQIAEFTNLIGEEFKVVLPPIGLTSDFSRTYLLNEKSIVKISSLYEGSNCIATYFNTLSNAKPTSLELNDSTFEDWITYLGISTANPIKTYEDKSYIRKKLNRLVELYKSSDFNSQKVSYRSLGDLPNVIKNNNLKKDLDFPVVSIIEKEIEADYRSLNDSNRYSDFIKFKNIFLNIRINSTDGCFKYNSTNALNNLSLNQFSSVNYGPPHLYYFSQKYSSSLSCKVKVSIFGSSFDVGEVTLLADSPKNVLNKTITCAKGKVIKKIMGPSPKCPNGYKLRG